MNYLDGKYLNERLAKLENTVTGNPASSFGYRTKEQEEIERLKKENETLRQLAQKQADPVRAEFEQSREYRDAWMSNYISYKFEQDMPQWAASPYAQKLDEWANKRIEEIRQLKAAQVAQPAQQSPVQQNNQGGM